VANCEGDIESFKDYQGKTSKLIDDLATGRCSVSGPKGTFTSAESSLLLQAISKRLTYLVSHLRNVKSLSERLLEQYPAEDGLFASGEVLTKVVKYLKKLPPIFIEVPLIPSDHESTGSCSSKRSLSGSSTGGEDIEAKRWKEGDKTITEVLDDTVLISRNLANISLIGNAMAVDDSMTGINNPAPGGPVYTLIYKELIESYKDPMKNKRLKLRDVHDIDRIQTTFNSLKLEESDHTNWPEHLKEDILRSYYVLAYGWKFAQLYVKNQRAVTLGLPFIPALPSTVVSTGTASASYKFKKKGRSSQRTKRLGQKGNRAKKKKKSP